MTLRKFGKSEFSAKPLNDDNPDMVISVGYRVRSRRGVQFRQWAAEMIKEYKARTLSNVEQDYLLCTKNLQNKGAEPK